MDEIEGARRDKKSNYKRQKIVVWRNRQKVEARTYVGTTTGRKRFMRRSPEHRRVSEAYFEHILIGASRFNFSERYVAYLRKEAKIS